jgi:hypothetical protein
MRLRPYLLAKIDFLPPGIRDDLPGILLYNHNFIQSHLRWLNEELATGGSPTQAWDGVYRFYDFISLAVPPEMILKCVFMPAGKTQSSFFK